jgi:hypothetical protein
VDPTTHRALVCGNDVGDIAQLDGFDRGSGVPCLVVLQHQIHRSSPCQRRRRKRAACNFSAHMPPYHQLIVAIEDKPPLLPALPHGTWKKITGLV